MHGFLEVLLTVLRLLAIPLLLLGNAFFCAAEFAFVTVRRTRLEELAAKRVPGAGAAQEVTRRIDDMIAATQVAITMTSLGLGWVGEPALARIFQPWFQWLPVAWGPLAAHGVATAVAFLFITFLHVVVGEQAPKAVAIRIPDTVTLLLAGPVLAFERLFRPFILVVNWTGRGLTRLLGFRPMAHATHLHSVDELKLIVDDVSEAGTMSVEQAEILKNAFRLPEKKVREAMLPLAKATMLEYRMKPQGILDALQDSVHTRFPVYDGERTRVVGIVNSKDLFAIYATSGLVNLEDAMIEVTWAPADRSTADQLKEFRRARRQMGVVIDEAGEAIGIITLEDIVEELIGEVEDEHDPGGGATIPAAEVARPADPPPAADAPVKTPS